MRFAPRLDPRVFGVIRRLDDRSVPIAETSRRVGQALAEMGIPQPSYAHVRRLVLARREHRDARRELVDEVSAPLALGRLPDPYRVEQRRRGRPRR